MEFPSSKRSGLYYYSYKGGIHILQSIQNEINNLEKQLESARSEIDRLPRGRLRCTKSRGREQFYVDGKYISRDKTEIVKGVAQREYLEQTIPVMEKRLKLLYGLRENYASHELENQYNKVCPARKGIIVPIFETVEEKVKHFLEEEYAPGVFEETNNSEFYTEKGERVRSKSELLIAEHLNRYGIPYRYEKPLELKDRCRMVICRPDFTTMNKRTSKLFIYEHLGRMDDTEYVAKNIRKMELYEKNGYILGKNLIITHETSKSPLNMNIVDDYIKTFLM